MGQIVHIIKFEFGPFSYGRGSMECGDVSISDGMNEMYKVIYLDDTNHSELHEVYKPIWSSSAT